MAAHAESPRIDYLLYCGGCHLEDGRGAPPEVPDLTQALGDLVQFDEGRAYLVQVPGSFQAPISDERLSAVLNWMVASYRRGLAFEPFSGEEVARYRQQLLSDPLKHRQALLAEVARRNDSRAAQTAP